MPSQAFDRALVQQYALDVDRELDVMETDEPQRPHFTKLDDRCFLPGPHVVTRDRAAIWASMQANVTSSQSVRSSGWSYTRTFWSVASVRLNVPPCSHETVRPLTSFPR